MFEYFAANLNLNLPVQCEDHHKVPNYIKFSDFFGGEDLKAFHGHSMSRYDSANQRENGGGPLAWYP